MSLPIKSDAGEFISALQCTSNAGDKITATFGATSFDEVPLNCIDGDFVTDMAGCSPEGGYGLLSPTGPAEIVQLAFRWQDYAAWVGGIANNYVTATKIRFSGGVSKAEDYTENWHFLVDRPSGNAVLTWREQQTKYSCKEQ